MTPYEDLLAAYNKLEDCHDRLTADFRDLTKAHMAVPTIDQILTALTPYIPPGQRARAHAVLTRLFE